MTMPLFVHWTNTINLGAVIIVALMTTITLGGLVYWVVTRKGRIDNLNGDIADLQRDLENADRTAKRWETERDAAEAAMQRLKLEHLEQTAQFAEEQREVRHQLKADLAACQMELSAVSARTDQTVVVEGQKAIGSALLDGQKTIVDVIERMEERASRRDSAMLENQKKIAQSLETMANHVAERVSEVVQERLDAPSPDRTT